MSTDYQFSACYLTQLGTSFSYDYEYNGASCRLVLTPLTERAFLSLTQAIKNFHCGTLVGPAGVGKSETIKELAKVMVYGYIDSVWNISSSYKTKLTSIWISASYSIGVNPWPISRCLGGTCSQLTVTRMWRSGWWCSTWWGWSNQGAGHCLTTPTDWPKVRSTVLFIYWLHKNTWPCFILANHHDHCHWANFKLDKLLL